MPGINLLTGERGKSTLLRLLAAELSAQAGWIAACGVRPDTDLTSYRSKVFWVDTAMTGDDRMTPREAFSRLAARYGGLDLARAEVAACRLGLEPHLHKTLEMLSSGSRRKVWMAAAFASATPIVLLDDLFAALDRSSIEALTQMLAEEASRAERIWVVAHYDQPVGLSLRSVIDLDRLCTG